MSNDQPVSAEANGGYYEGRLECLSAPGDCQPPGRQPHDVGQLAVPSPSTRGYRHAFTPGPPPEPLPPEVSATSVTAWASTAVPVRPGQTGIRAFCIDASGALCVTDDGSLPTVTPGALCDPDSCTASPPAQGAPARDGR